MRRLLFIEILLMSAIEKKATRIQFDPKANLIIGKNDTGKSSLVKSLFRSFGAESENHHQWKSAKVTSLLKFTIDGELYSILRYGDLYSVFDKNAIFLKSFNSVTNELAPFMSNLLDFKIKIPDSNGKLIIPPPAYYFLPFYIDQDKGWVNNWTSFDRLGQIPKYKKHISEYHIGLRPNNYYDLLNQINSIKENVDEKNSEIRVQANVMSKLDQKVNPGQFNIDIETFQKEIEELLVECQKLKEKEDEQKTNLTKLYNQKMTINSQIKLVESSHSELKRDFEFANKHLEDSVECPTCGAVYDNSFNERFSIAQDENRCYELLQQLRNELHDIDVAINKAKSDFTKNTLNKNRISELLEVKKSQIKLQEVIENEGKKEVRQILKFDIDSMRSDVIKSEFDLHNIQKDLKKFDKSERKKEILGIYTEKMRAATISLNVYNLNDSCYKKVDARINETGSDKPRALLAYFYSILNVMSKYSSSVFAPVVIDSPNQQDQDDANLKRIYSFIIDKQPEGSQLILASADTDREIPFKGKRIILENKDSLLVKDQFEEVSTEINYYLTQSLFKE